MQSPHTLYADAFPQEYGHSFWLLEPNNRPYDYFVQGVQIGDVLVLTPDGGYDYLFNICRPKEDSVNAGRTYDGFEHLALDLDLETFNRVDWQSAGSCLGSSGGRMFSANLNASASAPELPVPVGAGFDFSASNSSGALLILPDGASRTDLRDRKRFQDWITQNIHAIFEHVNGRLFGRQATSIVIVTGCDKSTESVVVASTSASDLHKAWLNLSVTSAGVDLSYSSSFQCPSSTRVTPITYSNGGVKNKNHCSFARGLTCTKRRRYRIRSRNAIKVGDLSNDQSWNVEDKSGGSSFWSFSSFRSGPSSSSGQPSGLSPSSSSTVPFCEDQSNSSPCPELGDSDDEQDSQYQSVDDGEIHLNFPKTSRRDPWTEINEHFLRLHPDYDYVISYTTDLPRVPEQIPLLNDDQDVSATVREVHPGRAGDQVLDWPEPVVDACSQGTRANDEPSSLSSQTPDRSFHFNPDSLHPQDLESQRDTTSVHGAGTARWLFYELEQSNDSRSAEKRNTAADQGKIWQIHKQSSVQTSQQFPVSVQNDGKVRVSADLLHGIVANHARTFAFIVAINQFKYADGTNLKNLVGPVNDGKAMMDFLQRDLMVPKDNIFGLWDSQATREAILRDFQRLLIEDTRIQRDDLIIIFFATHGTRTHAPDGWTTNDGLIEAICPHDMTPASVQFIQPVHAIPDYTLNSLLRQLAGRKGNNIVVILDCCFSASLTRDDEEERYCHNPLPIPPYLDKEIWDAEEEDGPRVVRQPQHFHTDPDSHVLLASSTETQSSSSLTFQGRTRGVFTFYLLRELKNVLKDGRQCTYVELVESVGNSMRAFFQKVGSGGQLSQTPQCIGVHRHRYLFSTQSSVQTPQQFPVSNLAVHAEQPIDRYLRSDNPFYHLVDSKSSAQLTLKLGDYSQVEFKRSDPLISSLAHKTISSPVQPNRLPAVLEAISRFYHHFYFAAGASTGVWGNLNVQMHLFRLQPNPTGLYTADGVDLFRNHQAKVPNDQSKKYGLEIVNRSNKDLFVYVFLFEPSDYSIQAWYKPLSNQPFLKAMSNGRPGRISVGYGSGGGELLEFCAPPGDFDTSFLKVFVSERHVNLNHLEQGSAFDNNSRMNRDHIASDQAWSSIMGSVCVG